MKSPIQLIEEIIRAKMALHLRLVAHRNDGEMEIGGKSISDMLAEVDAGIPSYERMLVHFKNKVAAEVMASAAADDESEIPSERGPLPQDSPLD
jgi:hypothetical protein